MNDRIADLFSGTVGFSIAHESSFTPCAHTRSSGRVLVAAFIFVYTCLSLACVDRSGSSSVATPEDGREDLSPYEGGQSDPEFGRLTARPGGALQLGSGEWGLRRLPLRGGNALLFIPPGHQGTKQAPFALELHGAGGNARGGIGPFLNAGPAGVILLSVKSQGPTWDLLQGAKGSDVDFIDHALGYVFDHWKIDRSHLAVLGFSDGASSALSLGITNGDLFSHVVALSPGFLNTERPRGHPHIFIGHGSHDEVLPIESTSCQIAPRLQDEGYDVTLRVHDGGHNPRPMARSALSWFLDDEALAAPEESSNVARSSCLRARN